DIERSAGVEHVTWGAGEGGDREPARPGKAEPFEQPSAFTIWTRTQVLAVDDEQIEGDERDVLPACCPQVRTEPVEVAGASGVRDQLAVEHEATADVRQRPQVVDRSVMSRPLRVRTLTASST